MKIQKYEQLIEDESPDGIRYIFFCPACDETHSVLCNRPGGKSPNWKFDENKECPTFVPSILIYYPTLKKDFDHSKGLPQYPDDYDKIIKCHLFILSGKIVYCTDSSHALSGQTIDLPDIPLELIW